ncbi:hypothetical protein O3P69_008767 [Scylla paramamosain]|uniref:Uncharacterized protein n=1 Tax=Scylla paramamosain TaxID=85552 RepID=A0AAW0SNJ6_SCYPA
MKGSSLRSRHLRKFGGASEVKDDQATKEHKGRTNTFYPVVLITPPAYPAQETSKGNHYLPGRPDEQRPRLNLWATAR